MIILGFSHLLEAKRENMKRGWSSSDQETKVKIESDTKRSRSSDQSTKVKIETDAEPNPRSLNRTTKIIIQDDTYKDVIKWQTLPKSFLPEAGRPEDSLNGTKDCSHSFALMVEPNDSIGAVKSYIQDEKGIPFKKQKLLNEEGRTLRDSHSLTSLGIKKCSTLILRYVPVTRIIVRNIVSGRVLEIMVWPDDTIGHVKAVIQEKHGIRFHRQKLTFRGNEPGDSERLANIGIQNDSILVVGCKSVTHVFVIYKFSGLIFKVRVDPDDTIGDVKAIICEKEGIPFHKQRLIFSGKECSDSELLTNIGIQDDSELILHHLSD